MQTRSVPKGSGTPPGAGAWLLLFAVCLGFWVLLSGHHDAFHLGAGALCAALTASLTVGLERRARFLGSDDAAGGPGPPLFRLSATWWRLLLYLPWLFWEVVRSAVQIGAVLVHPRLPIDPVLVRLRTGLEGDLPQTTYANSITLTPGTVTVEFQGRELVVHALTRQAADGLRTGTMEARVRRAFGQRVP
jgi:multicomponent Na+:H+ antiporter subunit E